MKKNIVQVFVILFCLLITPQVMGVRVEVTVGSNIGGNVEYFEMDEEVNGVQEFLIQWYNSQSVSCESMMQFDVYREGELVGTAWSETKEMLSGISDSFSGYWIPEEKGNYSVKIKVHHCHEIIETEGMNFTVNSVPEPEEKIQVKLDNMPEGNLEVKLLSSEGLDEVAVVPEDYPLGWVFSGEKVNLSPGQEKSVIIKYDPSVWRKEEVTIKAVSMDGTVSGSKSVLLEKKKSFMEEYGTIMLVVLSIALVISVLVNILFLLKRWNLKHRKL